MSTTAVSVTPTSSRSWMHALRFVLVATAVVVLLAVSFVIGRATATTTAANSPVIAPAAPATPAQSRVGVCPMRGPC